MPQDLCQGPQRAAELATKTQRHEGLKFIGSPRRGALCLGVFVAIITSRHSRTFTQNLSEHGQN